jgi:hypothetical protein
VQVLAGGFILCGVVWMGWLVVRYMRSRQQEKKMALHPAAVLYRRLRINLANAGMSAPPSMTPREFLECHEVRIAHYPRVEDTLRVGTEIYEKTIYSPLAPKHEEIIFLRNSIKKSNLERIKLRFRYVFNRIYQKLISSHS